jgi:hypothetical protein
MWRLGLELDRGKFRNRAYAHRRVSTRIERKKSQNPDPLHPKGSATRPARRATRKATRRGRWESNQYVPRRVIFNE